MTWLERLLAWLNVERHDIGRKGLDKYLTRYVLWGNRDSGTGCKVYLHLFHRGDAESYCHDHPWGFWSLILWGGYFEWTPYQGNDPDHVFASQVRKWYGPLSLLRRPAEWKHRVEIPPGRRCWTLVWVGAKTRSWGFWCPGLGWIPWRQHEANQAAGGPGCGE